MPSLIRLSPSTSMIPRRGRRCARAIAVAASGSVGRRTPQGEGGAPGHAVDDRVRDDRDPQAVTTTKPTASIEIASQVGPQVAQVGEEGGGVEQRRGEEATRTRSGSISASGRPGSTPRTTPPMTSRIGYGTLISRAIVLSAATATISPRISSPA